MKPVIVIGMHRSGTSLMVKVLEKLGVFMGEDQERNGESLFFLNINRWIFSQAHIRWDDPKNYKHFSSEAKHTLIPIIKNRINSFHKKQYFGNKRKHCSFFNSDFLWGWKDPRNTFTLNIWSKIFENLSVIHIYRNPVDVVASLQKREMAARLHFGNQTKDKIKNKYYGYKLSKKALFHLSFIGLELEGGFSLWKEYVTRAFSLSEYSSNIIHISFEELISSPERIMADVSKFLDLESEIFSPNEFINVDRKFPFLNNPELLKFYVKIKDDELVKKLCYHEIV